MIFSLKSLTTILAFVANALAASEQDAIASPDSAVVKLTAEDFHGFIKENPLVLTEFFAPWCGHCKALGPEFSKAADALTEKNIKLVQIDCTEQQELCQEHEIKGYPTLKVFRGHEQEPKDYQGPRSAQGIVNYMIKQSLPAVSLINDFDDLNDFILETQSAVIVETGSSHNESLYKLADILREEYTFVQTASKEFADKYGKDKILIFLDKDEEPVAYEGDGTYESIVEFINVESVPLFGELDGSTYHKYAESSLPLGYFFYTSEDERAKWAKTFTKIAKEHRGKINFVAIDAIKFGRHAENLNMEQEFPLFVIHDSTNKKFGFPQDEELTEAQVVEFVEKYTKGEVEPKVKTEEIPEVQENAVFKIVGKTHDSVINDSTKDVLVKYYAPWCGHCKRLAPTYEELAELYASDADAAEKVVIANVDATLNDVDVEISGYPTLILYPANNKTPIVYEGGRDLDSLVSFIKENGSFKVDGSAITAPAKEEAEADEETAGHDEL